MKPQCQALDRDLNGTRAATAQAHGARRAYAESIALIEGVASGLSDARLRQTFLDSVHVRSIRRAAGA